MIRVEVNRDTCSGFGNCVGVADAIFDLDGEGLVVLLSPTVSDAELSVVRLAAYDCPTDSITWSQFTPGEP